MQTHSSPSGKRATRSPERRKINVWPIHTESDYDRAVEVMNQLALEPEGSLSRDDQDRLDIFTELIAAYDSAHYRIDTSHLTPVDMLKYLMEQRGMNASDLGRVLGNRQTGHDVLSGRRQLSKAHIRKLADYFHMTPDLFL